MKKLRKICDWVTLLCFMRLWGLAGLLELDMISFAELVAQMIPAAVIMAASAWIGERI